MEYNVACLNPELLDGLCTFADHRAWFRQRLSSHYIYPRLASGTVGKATLRLLDGTSLPGPRELVLAEAADAEKGCYLLFRRACVQPEAWQVNFVWSSQTCDVLTLVWVAGNRWRIESAFEMAKQDVGLNQ